MDTALRSIGRFALAGFSVACGWLFQFLLYAVLAPGTSQQDRIAWAAWTGCFCLAGWIVVGLPIVIANPQIYSGTRIASATVISGLIGMAMVGIFIGGLDPFFVPLAFLTAASSMFVYTMLNRALTGDAFDAASHRD